VARHPAPTDETQMLNLWRANKPSSDEHRLAFTVNFSTVESNRLKSKREKYITEALRTIRDLLRDFKPTTIIVVVERNKRLTVTPTGLVTDLHAHGWIVVRDTLTAKSLQSGLYEKGNPKITAKAGIHIQDTYVCPKDLTVKPLDTGWAEYCSKDFGRTPTGCRRPNHFYSASGNAKSLAGIYWRLKKTTMNRLRRIIKREDRMISRNEGEWKHFSKGNDHEYIQKK